MISDVLITYMDERHTCGSYHQSLSSSSQRIVVVVVIKSIVLYIVTFIIGADKKSPLIKQIKITFLYFDNIHFPEMFRITAAYLLLHC